MRGYLTREGMAPKELVAIGQRELIRYASSAAGAGAGVSGIAMTTWPLSRELGTAVSGDGGGNR